MKIVARVSSATKPNTMITLEGIEPEESPGAEYYGNDSQEDNGCRVHGKIQYKCRGYDAARDTVTHHEVGTCGLTASSGRRDSREVDIGRTVKKALEMAALISAPLKNGQDGNTFEPYKHRSRYYSEHDK